MEKEEAYSNFMKQYAIPLQKEYLTSLEEVLEEKYDKIQTDLINIFRKFFVMIRERQEKGKSRIAHIYLHILRTGLKTGSYVSLLSAYDESWYMDRTPIELGYETEWLWKNHREYTEKLKLESRRYAGKVTYLDLCRISMDKWDIYTSYLYLLLKNTAEKIAKEADIYIEKADLFTLWMGEYLDTAEKLWVEDRIIKDSNKIKTLFESKKGIADLHISGMDLSEGDYSESDMSGSRFAKSNLSTSDMSACILLGSCFENCNLQKTDFTASQIWGCSFKNSNLRGGILQHANIYSAPNIAIIRRKYFPKTSFRGADLSFSDLSHGNFMAADFREAELEGCNLTEAVLTEALIEERYRDSLNLTEEQRGEIKWL